MLMSGALSSMIAVRLSGSRVNDGVVVSFETFPAAPRSRSWSDDNNSDRL